MWRKDISFVKASLALLDTENDLITEQWREKKRILWFICPIQRGSTRLKLQLQKQEKLYSKNRNQQLNL